MGWSEQVERNLKAMEYEESGNIQEAIKLYEKNVAEEFDGTHPYQRLFDLYVELDQTEDVIRILEKGIHILDGVKADDYTDKCDQLKRFKQAYKNITKTLNDDN